MQKTTRFNHKSRFLQNNKKLNYKENYLRVKNTEKLIDEGAKISQKFNKTNIKKKFFKKGKFKQNIANFKIKIKYFLIQQLVTISSIIN